jgi:hypothetical protein
MPKTQFPELLSTQSPRVGRPSKLYPPHREWVRRHCCSVPGCQYGPIHCSYLHRPCQETTDRWTISLCEFHDAEKYQLGDGGFESKYRLDLSKLALAFAQRSPHRDFLL